MVGWTGVHPRRETRSSSAVARPIYPGKGALSGTPTTTHGPFFLAENRHKGLMYNWEEESDDMPAPITF